MDVKLDPTDQLTVTKDAPVPLTITNDGDERVAYRTKTTRPMSLKLNHPVGFVGAKSIVTISVSYKPADGEQVAQDSDHISLLFASVPANFTGTAGEYWAVAKEHIMRRSLHLVIYEDKSRTVSPASGTTNVSDDDEEMHANGSAAPKPKTWSKLKEKKKAEEKKTYAKRLKVKKSKKSKGETTATKEDK